MRIKAIFLLIFVLTLAPAFGQVNQKSRVSTDGPDPDFDRERVYVHFNRSLLFSGENLKYKFYCFDKNRKNLSPISKIGYVSLVAKDGSSVFDHKIKLNGGCGYSDAHIPTTVPTGAYKLVGYTNWMINEGSEVFFKADIHIVNPYRKLPEAHINRSTDSAAAIDRVRKPNSKIMAGRQSMKPTLEMHLSSATIGRRQKVQLAISALTPEAAQGSYSLSVRKNDPFETPVMPSAEAFAKSLQQSRGEAGLKATGVLPELRGALISGIIKNKDNGQPAADKVLSLSLPGVDYLHCIAISNAKGQFYFNINEEFDNERGVVQVVSANDAKYEITMYRQAIDYGQLAFKDLKLSKTQNDYILERSIHNQLENAYQEVRADSVHKAKHPLPFYRKLQTVYNLDDFTRFNSLPETIVEVIDHVGTRKLPNGDRVFEVRPDVGVSNNDLLPMVFVDGLFIERHQTIMDVSAKKVRSIGFSRGIYVLGAQTFQGILHIETLDGNFYQDFEPPYAKSIALFKAQSRKDYFKQEYAKDGQHDQVPDFRRQLLWMPEVDLATGSSEIVFYTSDIEGDYTIVLNGFDANGRPIKLSKKLYVD